MLTLAPSALIMTTHGLRRAGQLLRKPFWTYLDGLAHFCPEGMQELEVQPVAELVTREGYRLILSPESALLTPLGPIPVQALEESQPLCLNRHYPYGMWIGQGSFAEGHEAGQRESGSDCKTDPDSHSTLPELAGLSSQYGRGILQALFSQRGLVCPQGRLKLHWHPDGLQWVQSLLVQYGLFSHRHPDHLLLEWNSTVNFAHYIYGLTSSQPEYGWPQDPQPYPTATFEGLQFLQPQELLGCRIEGKNRLAIGGLLLEAL